MAREEIVENRNEVFAAKVKEIAGLYDSGCPKRWLRLKRSIIIDVRWVILWKMIKGNVGVTCRLAVRGFKDKYQDFDIYAGATSHSGQSLVNAVAIENPEFILLRLDVSQAFAKGNGIRRV